MPQYTEQAAEHKGRGKEPFGTSALESCETRVAAALERPLAAPLGLVPLPHFVERLHHLMVDDKCYSHIQADPVSDWLAIVPL